MLSFLIRVGAFVLAMALLVDTFLPSRFESVQVDRHVRRDNTRTDQRGFQSHDIDYLVYFAGGMVGSCEIGYSAYNALQDGDRVTVQTSRVFKECIAIDRDNLAMYRATYWRFGSAVPALILLAISFGWLEWGSSNDYDDRGSGWFLRRR